MAALGKAYSYLGDYARAEAALRRALALDPGLVQARAYLEAAAAER